MSEQGLAPTPGQTIGPFFGYALPYGGGDALVPRDDPRAVRLHGYVLDGSGAPVPDALLEIWQADGSGQTPQVAGSLHRDGYTFTGWGRAATDNLGHYSFTTVEPAVNGGDRARFIAMAVFARGLTHGLFTRIYLDQAAAQDDAFLATVPASRRGTLLAVGESTGSLRFDVRLQGDDETVFLAFTP
jgi:protocatechuate 3,4-dioxygenase, alpha subunit